MNKYEGMFIVKPDLAEEEKKTVFGQINDAIAKNNGDIASSAIWSERRKLCFPIKKCREGIYYLLNFNLEDPQKMSQIRQIYKLNENILRVLITKQ